MISRTHPRFFSLGLAFASAGRRRLGATATAMFLACAACGEDDVGPSGSGGATSTSGATSTIGATSSTSAGGTAPRCGSFRHLPITTASDGFSRMTIAQTADASLWASYTPVSDDILERQMWVAQLQGESWSGGAVLPSSGFNNSITATGDSVHAVAINGFDVDHAVTVAGAPWENRGPLTDDDVDPYAAWLLPLLDGRLHLVLLRDGLISAGEVAGDAVAGFDGFPVPDDCYFPAPVVVAGGAVLVAASCAVDDFNDATLLARHDASGWTEVAAPVAPLDGLAGSPDGRRVVGFNQVYEDSCQHLTLWSLEGEAWSELASTELCEPVFSAESIAVDNDGRVYLALLTSGDGGDALHALEWDGQAFSAPVEIARLDGTGSIDDLLLDSSSNCPIFATTVHTGTATERWITIASTL